jgi:hypothetical protein
MLGRFEAIRNHVRDLNDIVANRAELAKLRDAVPDVISVNRRELDTANAAHAAMKHPPDLKPVYDQAFARIVTQPGELLGEMLPLLQAHLGAMAQLADFIAANQSKVEVFALTAEVKDPALKEELRRLISALHDRDEDTQALRRRFQAMVGGS